MAGAVSHRQANAAGSPVSPRIGGLESRCNGLACCCAKNKPPESVSRVRFDEEQWSALDTRRTEAIRCAVARESALGPGMSAQPVGKSMMFRAESAPMLCDVEVDERLVEYRPVAIAL